MIINESLDNIPISPKRQQQLNRLRKISKKYSIVDPSSSEIILPIVSKIKSSSDYDNFHFLALEKSCSPLLPLKSKSLFLLILHLQWQFTKHKVEQFIEWLLTSQITHTTYAVWNMLPSLLHSPELRTKATSDFWSTSREFLLGLAKPSTNTSAIWLGTALQLLFSMVVLHLLNLLMAAFQLSLVDWFGITSKPCNSQQTTGFLQLEGPPFVPARKLLSLVFALYICSLPCPLEHAQVEIEKPLAVNMIINGSLDNKPISPREDINLQLNHLHKISKNTTLIPPPLKLFLRPIISKMKASSDNQSFHIRIGNILQPIASIEVKEPFPFNLVAFANDSSQSTRQNHLSYCCWWSHKSSKPHCCMKEYATVFIACWPFSRVQHQRGGAT